MKLFTFNRIRTRLTFWFLLLIFIPLLTVLTITYFKQVNVIQSKTIDKLTAIRDLKVIELTNWIFERIGDLHVISSDKELTDLELIINKTSYNKSDNVILESSRQILNRYLTHYPAYYELFVIDPVNAKIVVSTNKKMEGRNRLTNDYFTKSIHYNEVAFKDVYYSTTLLANSMAYSIPIFCNEHSGKHIVGILVARINLEKSLYKMLMNRVGLGKTGETFIVNKDVVALNELRWYKNAPLKLKILAKPAVNAAAGKTGVLLTNDYRNKAVLAAYTYIPETGWGFVCKQDISELNEPIRLMLMNNIILFIITFLITILIVFSIGKSISKPIVNLNLIAQKINEGDFSIRNKITSHDEVGSLALTFNNMANSIESKMKIQKDVSDISKTMIKQSSLPEFSMSVLKHMMKITGADISVFYILNEATSEYEHFVSFGINKKLLKAIKSNKPDDEFKNALTEKTISYTSDISDETILKYKTKAKNNKPKEIVTIPIMVDNLIIALVVIVSVHKFNNFSLEVLKQSATSLNSSYSSLLSNERTRIFAEILSNANKQLKEQSDELKEQTEELQLNSKEMHENNIELKVRNNKISESKQALTNLLEDVNEASEKLREANTQLKNTNNELESFSYSVSHDLRAPLTRMDGFSKALLDFYSDNLDEKGKHYLNRIRVSSQIMAGLIDDLLRLSRITRHEILMQKIDISKIAKQVIDNLVNDNPEREVKAKIKELILIKCDPHLIKILLQNIISNAWKFTTNTEKSKIEIGTMEIENREVIYIKDNGAGFDMKYHDNIFKPFQRLHSDDDYKGSGIGMAIVQRIINRHSGKIWAESKVNIGTTFYFYV